MSKEMREQLERFKNWKLFLNENEGINNITSQLDKMGVKYELSNNGYFPFKVIYKPINKSDEFYRHFEEFIYLNNLEYAIKKQF